MTAAHDLHGPSRGGVHLDEPVQTICRWRPRGCERPAIGIAVASDTTLRNARPVCTECQHRARRIGWLVNLTPAAGSSAPERLLTPAGAPAAGP